MVIWHAVTDCRAVTDVPCHSETSPAAALNFYYLFGRSDSEVAQGGWTLRWQDSCSEAESDF
jgi:hypothetical protein